MSNQNLYKSFGTKSETKGESKREKKVKQKEIASEPKGEIYHRIMVATTKTSLNSI